MNVWYDVCNDYSLERRDTKPDDLEDCTKVTIRTDRNQRVDVYHENGSIYYVFAPEGLEELDGLEDFTEELIE